MNHTRSLWIQRTGALLLVLVAVNIVLGISFMPIGVADALGNENASYRFGKWQECPEKAAGAEAAEKSCRDGYTRFGLVRYEFVQERERLSDGFTKYRGVGLKWSIDWIATAILGGLVAILLAYSTRTRREVVPSSQE